MVPPRTGPGAPGAFNGFGSAKFLLACAWGRYSFVGATSGVSRGTNALGGSRGSPIKGEATAVGGAGIFDELDVVLVDDEEVVEGMEDLSLAF